MAKQSAKVLVKSALKLVESASIREWASSSHNLPIIIQIAQNQINKSGHVEPLRFATYLVCEAMGF